jgi:fibronectin type 3 domain-containing protein
MIIKRKKTLAAALCFVLLFMISAPEAWVTAESVPVQNTVVPEETAAAASPPPVASLSDVPENEPTPAPDRPSVMPDDWPAVPLPPGASLETALPLREDITIQGGITADFPVQYYLITLSQSGSYTFASGGSLPVKASLLDDGKKTLAIMTPDREDAGGTDSRHFTQTVSLKKGTDYLLAVQSAKSGKTGLFTLYFTREDTPVPSSVPDMTPLPDPEAEQTQENTPTPEPVTEISQESIPSTPVPDDAAEQTQANMPAPEPAAEMPQDDIASPPVPAETAEQTQQNTPTPITQEPATEQIQEETPAPPLPKPTDTAQPSPFPVSSAAVGTPFAAPDSGTKPPPVSVLPGSADLPVPAGILLSPGTAGWIILPVSKGINPYPESAHPYSNYLTKDCPYEEPDAIGYAITFHSDTYLQTGKDFLYLLDKEHHLLSFTDAKNTVWQRLTGNQADNVTLIINSPVFYTRLTTNGSITGYGFRYKTIIPIYPSSADTCVIYTCEQSSPSTVRIVWNEVSGAAGYTLYRSTGGTFTALKSVSSTSTVNLNLTPGQTYTYKVKPYTLNGQARVYGTYSNEISVRLLATPQFVKAIAIDMSTAYLDWADIEYADGYDIYRSTNPSGTYTCIKTVTGSFALDDTLAAGVTYYYKVTPWRMYSTKVLGTQSTASIGIFYHSPVLTMVRQSSQSTAIIEWTSQAGASGYSLYRSTTAAGVFKCMKSVQGTTTYNYNLLPGQAYYYKVRAYTDVNGSRWYGSYTGSLGVRILAAPVITSASIVGTTASIKWNAVAGAVGYILYRSESISGPFQYIKSTTGLSVSNYSLMPGKTYYYTVSGYRMYGTYKIRGAQSAPAEITPVSGTTYRALVIGQSDYLDLAPLHGAADSANVSSMLSHLSMGGKAYQTKLKTNLTAGQILSSIPSAFAGADNNDVSLFFYSGHGNNSTGPLAGSLYGIDSGTVTPIQLKNALDAVPGNVIVLIDSCGSGTYIYDGSLAKTAGAPATKANAYAFTSAVITAFSGSALKSGELLTSKYKVLTASEYGEYSYETALGGIFTNALCKAGGWDPISHVRIGLLGDTNSDSIVTLQEGYTYIYGNTDLGYQVVQVYPGSSNYPLFRR